MANNIPSTVQLVKEEDDCYSLNTVSTFRSTALKFKVNEEFLEETMDGRKINCLITFEGNKMIQQQTGENAVRIEREFTEDQLITKCMIEDIVGTRYFKGID